MCRAARNGLRACAPGARGLSWAGRTLVRRYHTVNHLPFSTSTWFSRAPARFGIFALLLAIVVVSLFGGAIATDRAFRATLWALSALAIAALAADSA